MKVGEGYLGIKCIKFESMFSLHLVWLLGAIFTNGAFSAMFQTMKNTMLIMAKEMRVADMNYKNNPCDEVKMHPIYRAHIFSF